MRLLFVIFTLLIASNHVFATSLSELKLPADSDSRTLVGEILLQDMVSNLLPTIHGTTIVLVEYDSPAIVAFHKRDGRIFVSSGLVEELQNIDELAFVLSHELAHLTFCEHNLAHTEHEADIRAVHYMRGLGFDPTSGVSLLSRFLEKDSGNSRSHPELKVRVSALNKLLYYQESSSQMAMNQVGYYVQR